MSDCQEALRADPPTALPVNATPFTVLRRAHTVLAYLFVFTAIAHFTAVLFHPLVIRDSLLERMVPWPVGPPVRPRPARAILPSLAM